MIDLHVHTNMSDGSFSPAEVVRLAAERGIKAIAITDHDTVAGIAEAQAEGARIGVEVIAGVEISAQWDAGILHILGFFVHPDNPELLRVLEYLREGRQARVPQILSKLRDCNVHITIDEVAREAVGGVPGRPHLANIMVRKGIVSEAQEAFDLYLKKGAPAYVKKTKIPPGEALRVIKAAEGLAVLAHPYSLDEQNPDGIREIIQGFVAQGLDGIEVYYPKHTPEQTKAFEEIASEFNLVVTGGSDFHGASKPEIILGVFPGRAPLPYSILHEMKTRKKVPTSRFSVVDPGGSVSADSCDTLAVDEVKAGRR